MVSAVISAAPALAQADVSLLPYAVRTQPFSGYSSTVQGDLRTLGMAGAMVGLADTYMASTSNPAGLAMTLPSLALQGSSNQASDGHVQAYDEPIQTNAFGFAGRFHPWGVSLGYSIPHRERQPYRLLSTGMISDVEVSVREFSISGARLFFDNRLSVGATITFGSAVRALGPLTYESSAVNLGLGALVQLPRRWLLGVSFTPPVTYSAQPGNDGGTPVLGFNRPVIRPLVLGVGTSWIPNRIFRGGFTINAVGRSEGAALLSDQDRSVGDNWTFQPRLGLNYTAVEYPEFKVFAMAGAYFEPSRISTRSDRMHVTGGLDFNVWIFNIGAAIDHAPEYNNAVFSFGLDLVRTSRKLELIPKGYSPNAKGILPDPTRLSDDDLPRPLVKNYVERGQTPDLIQIGKDLPTRLKRKLEEVGEELRDVLE